PCLCISFIQRVYRSFRLASHVWMCEYEFPDRWIECESIYSLSCRPYHHTCRSIQCISSSNLLPSWSNCIIQCCISTRLLHYMSSSFPLHSPTFMYTPNIVAMETRQSMFDDPSNGSNVTM